MKRCTYCGELIDNDAKRCRYCWNWLEVKGTQDSDTKENEIEQMKTLKRKIKKSSLLILSILLVVTTFLRVILAHP